MDLKQLFAGSEPTKPNGHNVGVRTEFPAEVKVRQGKEVFEYAKLHFELADLEKTFRQVPYERRQISGLVSSTMS